VATCLSAEQIALYVAGDATNATIVQRHVDGCETCRQCVAAAVHAGRGERTLGRYVVIDELGTGGMGVVYRAFDPELGRQIAVKLLHGEPDEARARLAREGRALAALSHPNVVTIYDIGTAGDDMFIAMELVAGTTLRRWLAEQPREQRDILDAFRQAGRGLAAAHASGLVHRDFKPENVLVRPDGRVQVGDFGLARTVGEPVETPDAATTGDGGGRLTRTGAVLGTIPYMAPEQVNGEQADARTDQFSFAVALFEALTGERPFPAATVAELRDQFRRGSDPSDVRDGQPTGIAKLAGWVRLAVARGLAFDPSARHPSMEAFVDALGRDPRRRRAWIAGVGALALGASAITAVIASRAHAPSCAAPRFDGIWDPARRTSIEAAFGATGKPFAHDAWTAATRALDAYTSSWTAAEVSACTDTRVAGTQSEALLDLRIECLDERRTAVAALVDVFANADAPVVENAVRAVQQLPQLAACADKAALAQTVRPPDSAVAAKVTAVRVQLAQATALRAAGKPEPAAAIATTAADAALAIGYAPLSAEALFARGTLELDRDHADVGDKTLALAADQAEAGRDDVTKAEALTQRVRAAQQRAQYEVAHDQAAHAAATLARLGPGHDALAARLANYDGGAYMGAGDYAHALELQQRALEIRDKLYAGDGPEVATVLNSIGNVQYNLGHFPEARAAHERALEIRRRVLGPHHPDVAGSDNNLSQVFDSLGKRDEALALLQQAKAIYDEVLGADSARSALVLGNIANLYRYAGRYQDAITAANTALAIEQKSLGPDHPLVATQHYVIGKCYLALRDYPHAEVELSRALELRRGKLGEQHPDVLATRRELARLALERGDAKQARDRLAALVALQQHVQGADNPDLPATIDLFAMALDAVGDHRGALAQFQQALAIDEKNLGTEHGDLVADLVGIGTEQLLVGDKAALTTFERADDLAHRLHDVEPSAVGDADFGLARAVWPSDRHRAHDLATAARAIFAAAGSAKANELRDADRWLAMHH
jgi:tetratricopeptide (TPR) repeat protein